MEESPAEACAAPEKFLHLVLPDVYVSKVGSHEWLLDQCRLSKPKIFESVRAVFQSRRPWICVTGDAHHAPLVTPIEGEVGRVMECLRKGS